MPRRLTASTTAVAALVLAALLVLPGAALAALPAKGARFVFHDHDTKGKNWHIDFRISPTDRQVVETLVLYSEECDATVAKENVPISDTGVVAANGKVPDGGMWGTYAGFKGTTELVGSMRITTPRCDTGALWFPNAVTGDGHADHEHGEGGHAHGPKFPDLESATRKERRQAVRLHRRVLDVWSGVSFAESKRLGFHRNPVFPRKLGVFHVYRSRYERDGRIFDPERPESLVFWRPSQGQPVLLGPMFRVPPGRPPAFGGPIPIYHSHGDGTSNQMTHVWMVKSLRMAWANCLPTKELHAYNPAFVWSAEGASAHIGGAC